MNQKPKQLLIVSYYWHPDTGTGVYRISKFAKYLSQLGWKITVLTASQGNSQGPEGVEEVVRVKGVKLNSFWSPSNASIKKEVEVNPSLFYKKNKSLKERLLIWARLNLLIPDAKIGWYMAAVNRGVKLVRQKQFDVILSTSPPPTASLVARTIAQKTKIPWVADFRDPWTKIYYYEAFPQGAIAARFNRKLEQSVLNRANAIICVNSNFFQRGAGNEKIHIIPNGFDPDDFKEVPQQNEESIFTVRYVGTLKMNQFSPGLIHALKRLNTIDTQLPASVKFEFIGDIDPAYKQIILDATPDMEIVFPGKVPHDQAIKKMQRANLLLLIIGRAITSKMVFSTKLFEYMKSNNPFLAIAHKDGAVAQLTKETQAGRCFAHGDGDGIYNFLRTAILKHTSGEKLVNPNLEKIESYSFVQLSHQLEKLLIDTTHPHA